MIVEGPRVAEEALREGASIKEAILSSGSSDLEALEAALRDAGIQPWRTDAATLAWLSHTTTPQGVLLVVGRPRHTAGGMVAVSSERSLLLVACGVQDPGNTGALVRLADAAGASGLVAAAGADPFGPRAVRASAGSIFRLPVARLPREEELPGFLASVRSAGFAVAGAAARGGDDFREAMPPRPLALVLGGEASGLPPAIEGMLDVRLTIPTNPRVESLNVAAAAAVLLFTSPRGSARPPSPASRPPRGSGRKPEGRPSRRGPSGRAGA